MLRQFEAAMRLNNRVLIVVVHINCTIIVVAGLRVSISRIENRRVGTARVRRGRSGLQQFADRRHRPIVRDIWRERSGQDGNDQIYSAIFVLGDQQREHVGRTADT